MIEANIVDFTFYYNPIKPDTPNRFIEETSINFYNLFPDIPNEEFAIITSKKLMECEGVYRKRYNEAYNLIYWLEIFIFLPKHIAKWFGVHLNVTLIKILQLIYWFFSPIIIYYQKEILNYLFPFLNL